jgi:tetratricopeptide (TPR) repeat protein
MNDTYSLVKILRDDPDLSKRLAKVKEAVAKDKSTLLQNAQEFNKQYEEEIDEGTKKRQKLIAEGKSQGLQEHEISWGSQFLPTRQTPILNFLYFLLRDRSNNVDKQIEQLRKIQEERFKNINIEEMDAESVYMLLKATGDTHLIEEAQDELNKKYGSLQDDFEADDSDNLEEAPEMDSLYFEAIGHDVFKKLKKLKALSRSPNRNEAFAAYTKCIELCESLGINFDKVPCNITSKIS